MSGHVTLTTNESDELDGRGNEFGVFLYGPLYFLLFQVLELIFFEVQTHLRTATERRG